MNQEDLEWYAEGYRNGWLNPEEKSWFEEGLMSGYFGQPTGQADYLDNLLHSWDSYQQQVGSGIENYAGEGGFGSWLADQSEDTRGYVPRNTGSFLESDNRTGWIVERGLENATATAMPYVTAGLGVAAAATAPFWGAPAAVILGGSALIGGILTFLANTGDVASDYEDRIKELRGKDAKVTDQDRAIIGGLSTVVTTIDLLPPLKLTTGNPLTKETIKKNLVDLATTDPKKFLEATKNFSSESLLPFLRSLGFEVSTEALQKAISDVGTDIAQGQYRDVGEYVSNALDEGMSAIFGGGTAIGTTVAMTPSQQPMAPKDKPLVHEKGRATKLADTVADTFGRKSVSVLNPYIEVTGEQGAAAQLHDIMEHREFGDAPGVVKAPDFFEQKLTQLGDLYNSVDNALARVRDNFRGTAMSKPTKALFDSFMNNKRTLTPNLQKAVDLAMSGDMSSLDKLKGQAKKLADTAYAARQVKETLSEINTRFNDIGVKKAYSETQSGLPLFFNTRNIARNKDAFNSWLQQNGYASNAVHAQEITEGILGSGGIPFLNEPIRHKSARQAPQGEKPGVVNKPFDPNTVPAQWLNQDIETALPKFAMKSATRIAHAKQFGPNGEILNDLVKRMINEVREAGHTVNDKDIKRIYDIQAALSGTYNQIRHGGLSDLNKAATVIQAASKLGGATLSSIQEPLIILERMGFGPALQSLPSAFSHIVRGTLRTLNRRFAKEHDMTQVANELGIAQDYANSEILTQTFSAEHAKMLDTFFKSPFGMFLYQWTRFVRSWGTGAAMIKMDNYQREFTSGKLKKLTRDQLADLGFSIQDFAFLTDLANKAGVKLSEVLIQNAKNPNQMSELILDAQLPSGASARGLLRSAILRMVNDAVIAPRATVRPMWLNDPHFAIIGELKSFPIVFGNTVAKRIGRKINPKNMKCGGGLAQGISALMVTAGLIGIAEAMQSVKYKLWGGKDPSDRPRLEHADKLQDVVDSELFQAVETSGLLGPWDFVAQTYQHGLEALFGPTYGDMSKLVEEAQKLGRDKSMPEDFAQYLGERTAQVMGSIGKDKEVQEAVGGFFYDSVY